MLSRIKQIIEKEKLSSTQFATEIGVQRSALSHVLSGRNKPSLDFMMKIKNRYPEINLDWLMLGKGKMIGATGIKEAIKSQVIKKEEYKETPKEAHFRVKQDEIDEIIEERKIKVDKTEKQAVETETLGKEDPGLPKKIILLYPDDTYETYNPRK